MELDLFRRLWLAEEGVSEQKDETSGNTERVQRAHFLVLEYVHCQVGEGLMRL